MTLDEFPTVHLGGIDVGPEETVVTDSFGLGACTASAKATAQ